jgi:triacylglycerol esterase/lipase EstA (alpha/beta hydrolase family)
MTHTVSSSRSARHGRSAAVLVALALLATLLPGLAAAPAQASLRVGEYPTLGFPPAGANDWSCRPTDRRPVPAIIVHGTFGDQKSLLDKLSLRLKGDGHCVFALDYGNRATGPVEESAAQLDGFVERVREATGAPTVNLVGHSQGGMMPRYYIKYLGGDGVVEDLVGLAPSNHGTTRSERLWSFGLCVSCEQQGTGSAFLTDLNTPDETPGDVDYTQVVTRYDEVVVPYTSGFLAGGRSTNITLQDRCPAELTEHLLIPTSSQAIAWTLDAFNREGPADPAAPIGCRG